MSKKRKSIESKNTTPILIFVSVVAFGIVVALAQFTSHLEEFSDRNPASIQKQQFKKLHEKLSVHQKIKPPISISIEKELIGKIYA